MGRGWIGTIAALGLVCLTSSGVFAADEHEPTQAAFEAEYERLIEAGETELANELRVQFEAYERDATIQAAVLHEIEAPEKAAEHLRQAIERLEAEGKTEEANKLSEVLGKLERGEITPEQCELQVREIVGDDLFVGPPVEIGGGTDDYLPPEVQAKLDKLFQEKGTGDPAKDAHVRAEAEQILREHGIEPPEWMREGPWKEGTWEHEADWEHYKDEWEHLSAAQQREWAEQGFSEREFGAFEHTQEAPEHYYEAPERYYEAPEQYHQEYQEQPQP